jgi:quaternary ammonium compound-resistance protein SugE
MPWLFLFLAGLFEIGWAIGLKVSDGFTRLGPAVWTVVCMIFSIAFLSAALRHLPVGTAYAIWTGIGAVGVATIGIVSLDEPRDALRLVAIGLIVCGIVLLKVVTREG